VNSHSISEEIPYFFMKPKFHYVLTRARHWSLLWHRCIQSTTNQLTPWSRVLLEKLIVTQLLKKFPTNFWTRRFIIMLIAAWSLSWAYDYSLQLPTLCP